MNHEKTSKTIEVRIPSKDDTKTTIIDYIVSPVAFLVNKFFTKITTSLNNFSELAAIFLFSLIVFYKNWKMGKSVIRNIIMKQIFFTGFDGITVIGIVSFIMGALIIMIFTTVEIPFMSMMASKYEVISMVLIQGMIQHLGPLLTSIILIGRSGTAISTEIGNMKVNHEIEALEAIGVNILHYIIAPRLIGMIVSITALTLYFAIIGVVGGVIIATLMVDDFILSQFIPAFFQMIEIEPVLEAVLKSIGCGCAIAIISSFHGMQVRQSYIEVPRATTKAVVQEIIICFFIFGYVSFLFIMMK